MAFKGLSPAAWRADGARYLVSLAARTDIAFSRSLQFVASDLAAIAWTAEGKKGGAL